MSWARVGLQWFRNHPKTTFLLVGGATVGGVYKFNALNTAKKNREKWNSVETDKVVLHMVPRGRTAPNISPYPLKLETYLRMANIPYEAEYSEPMGPKGKTPWITLNGEEMGDSQLIMEFLGKKYNKDLSQNLTPEQHGQGKAFQVMMDEHFIWGLALWRFVYDKSRSIEQIQKLPKSEECVFKYIIPRMVMRNAWCQGIGRHSQEEVTELMLKDLQALNDFLGTKPFLLGTEPTEYDCAVFGMLAQCVWCLPGSPYQKALDGELKPLKEYCYRMKERFWPDWDACINP